MPIHQIRRLKAVGLQVIIVPHPTQTEVEGIAIPESVQKAPLSGDVIAVGGGRPDYVMNAKVGDIAHYPRHYGAETTIKNAEGEDVNVVVIRDSDLLFLWTLEDEVDSSPVADSLAEVKLASPAMRVLNGDEQ